MNETPVHIVLAVFFTGVVVGIAIMDIRSIIKERRKH